MNLWTETPHRDASGAVKIALAKCSMLCHHGRIQPEALACKRLWLVATSLRSGRLASHASTPATLLSRLQTTVRRRQAPAARLQALMAEAERVLTSQAQQVSRRRQSGSRSQEGDVLLQ